MNIASGVACERGKALGKFDPKEYLLKLMNEKFCGYISLTVSGDKGFEEATIVLNNGQITCCDYEYFKFNRKFSAEDGLKRAFNAFLAKNGVLDCFSLRPQQVQLVMTLNEDCVLREPVGEHALALPASFSTDYEKEVAGELAKTEETRSWFLKKYGLTKLSV